MLVVVDFDEGDAGCAVGLLDVVGLGVAQQALPEVEGFGEIGHEETGVRDAQDVWALDDILRGKAGGGEQEEEKTEQSGGCPLAETNERHGGSLSCGFSIFAQAADGIDAC